MNGNAEFKSFKNFSKDKYSYNDYLKVKDYINEVEQNREVKKILIDQWKELVDEPESNISSLSHIFEKVQYKILLEEKKSDKSKFIWNFYKQVAAILLFPVLLFSIWYYTFSSSPQFISQAIEQSWIEINAPDGARVKFALPDGSLGWLNSGGKLKYPAKFNKHRKVELTGEAYFDVKHLEQSDFTVSVADMDIKVLGTKFNVSAYSNDPFTCVVLEEGKVEMNGKTALFSHTLLPNEKVIFNHKLKSLTTSEVEAARYIGWKDGYLTIENEPLEQVINRIERWYNVEIIVQDEKLKSYRFKATFKDEPLEELLRLIAKSTPINYHIQKREIDSNGIFQKRRVTIKSK